ncbi:MAG: amidohydrolase [Anaerovoracaceae bacterium]
MEKAWINGNIFTLDKAYGHCSAIYSKDGVIMALGTDKEIVNLAEKHGAEICNLNQRTVLPSFTDSHMHLLEYAQQDSMVHLEAAKSFDDVTAMLKEHLLWAKENNKWICGVGFNQDDWERKMIPTRNDLDAVSEDIPITIRRSCLHVSVCNTKAMEIMGIMDHIPEEEKENFDLYADGTPNGIIREMSQLRISNAFPALKKEEIKELIIHGCRKLAEKGITEVQTDDFHSLPEEHGETIMEAYTELSEEERLPIRVYEQCYLTDKEGLDKFLDDGHYTGENHGNFTIGPLKVVMDGSLGSHSAYLKQEYANEPGQHGIVYYSDEELYGYLKKAHDSGMQIAIHCIGDAALEIALNALESVQWENPRTDCRHGIVHCQIMDDKQTERFRKMNVIGYVQPIFLKCDMNIVDDCVGSEKASQSYNWRKLIDSGVHLSGGSDCPVESFDIMSNIQYAVSRKNFETGKSWYPENAVTLDEAINMFTCEGAYASFGENVRGTICVGKETNMVILDRNIYEIPQKDIDKIKILETIYKGNTVYKSR